MSSALERGRALELMAVETGVALPPEVEQYRQLIKRRLRWHTRFVYGYSMPWHQQVWCEALEDMSIRRLLVIGPPKYGKSPVIGDYLGWRIGNDPGGYHCIYVSNTATQANKYSVALRDTIAQNENYRFLYGLEPDTTKGWGENEWFIKRKNEADKDPTLQATGVGGPILGATVQEVVFDDIADEENMATAYQRQKLMEWVKSTPMSRLVPNGRAIMICTRWNEQDPAAELEAQGWTVMHLPAIDEDGNSTYPEYWSLDDLIGEKPESAKSSLGIRDFEMMFQGHVLPEEGGIFKREWWRYFKQGQAPWQLSPESSAYLPIRAIVQSWDSVSGDAVLTLRCNGVVKVMTFDDFWNVIDAPVLIVNDRSIKPVGGWEIWDRRGFTSVVNISRHWFHGELKDIKNRCGRVLVTDNHSVISVNGVKIIPSRLRYRTNLPAPPWRRVPLKRQSVRSLFVGSIELAWACGLFIAEGSTYAIKRQKERYSDETATSIANSQPELLRKAQEAISLELHVLMALLGPDKKGMYRLQSYDRLLYRYFNRFYDGRKEKIVPDDLFNALPEIREALLAGYMAGDGYETGKMKCITSKSPILAHQLVWMFNELQGWKPRFYWRQDKPHIYHVQIGKHRLDTLSNIIRNVPYTGFVYDVETESHQFRAGNILVANTAFKEKQANDYSVCTTWAVLDNGFYAIDLWRGRVEFPALKQTSVSLWEKWKPMAVLIEDASSGQSLIQELKAKTRMPVIAVKVDRDKVSRAHAVTPLFEAGKVYLPEEAAWRPQFEYEHEVFPGGSNDDQVDSVTQFLNWARTHVMTGLKQPAGVSKKPTWRVD